MATPEAAEAALRPILGLLLAGGRSRRLGGGDKCLRQLGDRTMLEHVIDRAAPQVAELLINANGDPARFRRFGMPIVADEVGGFAGPLAGILAGLEWARANRPHCRFVASFATDTPFFPTDLVKRLVEAAVTEDADLALAASAGRPHPVFGLWPVRLAAALRHALVEERLHKIDAWTARYRVALATFAAVSFDPFFNVNAPDDLHAAEAIIASSAGALGRRFQP